MSPFTSIPSSWPRLQNLWPLLLLCAASLPAVAQLPDAPTPEVPPAEKVTLFPHPDAPRYFISGQANIIFQGHAPFHSPYSGPNSLLSRGEYKTSLVGTLFLGYQLVKRPRFSLDAIYDEESAGGRGISEALGLAGFTNLDVVRNPSLGPVPYSARYELHQVIGLSGTNVESERNPFSLATSLPIRRVEFWVGRMGIPDFFDLNSVGTDSHLQFLNWTVDNNGAWDYAANTRGYTDALVAQYTDHDFTARYAIAAMPTIANGIDLDYAFHRSSGQNFEIEKRSPRHDYWPWGGANAIRILGFVNHANMGDYRQQNNLFLSGLTPTPDITAHPQQTTVKYGIGVNAEQEITPNTRIYGRFGWNEGQHESYAYTEVDQTISIGGDYAMQRFGRANDKLGLTFVSNAIKRDHQWYLAHGGLGFLLGDGTLNYAREDILEGYYNYHAWRGVFYALDEQFIAHPGYNQSRGPVMVESLRMHVDF